MSDKYVALLRGINVGGRNKLPMAHLRDIFVDAGCEDVRSYIQSGNVAFTARADAADTLSDAVALRIEAEYGYDIPVVLRSAAALRAAASDNPFLKRGAEERALHLMFLADQPAQEDVAALDPDRSPPDEFVVSDREIYLYCPNGVGRSKLTNAYFDRRLGTISTSRNWRTVNKLLELVAD